MTTIYKCVQIAENNQWTKNIKDTIKTLKRENSRFLEFKKVIIIGKDSKDIIPIKFLQPTVNLFIFQRNGFTMENYTECIKLFGYCVHGYYATHDNHRQLCNRIGNLQGQMAGLPTQIGVLSDIMDTFYMTIMSGKYIDRNKTLEVKKKNLKNLADSIKEAYTKFPIDPFPAIGGACIDSILKEFYKIDFKITLPEWQAANLVLTRIQEIARDAVTAIGPPATYDYAFKFFNLTSTFINSVISDIKVKKESRRVKR